MADIQTLFTPTNTTTSFEDLDNSTFFEHDGKLFYKIDDDNFLSFEDGEIDTHSIYNDDFDLDGSVQVVRAPAGTGVTIMQTA